MPRVHSRPNATVRDVARVARVSTATVSRALRFPEVVRPATRVRIERAVARLNYVSHGVARALSTRRTDAARRADPPNRDRCLHSGVRLQRARRSG